MTVWKRLFPWTLWALCCAGLALVCAQLKEVPQLIFVLLFFVPLALPPRARRGGLLVLLLFCAVIWGYFVGYGVAINLFPAVTDDGHPVMPVGQALFGGPLGSVLAVLLAWRVRPTVAEGDAVLTVWTRAFAVMGVVQGLVALWDRLGPS